MEMNTSILQDARATCSKEFQRMWWLKERWFNVIRASKNQVTVDIKNSFESPSVNSNIVPSFVGTSGSSFKRSNYCSCSFEKPQGCGSQIAFVAATGKLNAGHIDYPSLGRIDLKKRAILKCRNHLVWLVPVQKKSKCYQV